MYNSNNFKQFTHMAILSYGQVGWRSAVAAPVSGIDADAQAFITAASITDNTQKSAINTLVTQLKTYGIWTKLKAVYPFVGGTASSHKFNLKDPRDLDAAYRLVFNGGWTHSSTGALPNGSNAYANTKFNPQSSLTLNSEHLSYYSRTTSNGTEVEIGAESGVPYSLIEIRTAGTTYTQIQGGGYLTYSDSDSKGLYVANRNSSTNQNMWKNGVKLATGAGTPPGLVNQNIYIGAFNNPTYSPFINYYSTKESAFASIGDGLSDTEAANFYTAVQTFQTTLGRHVGVPIVADTDAQAFLNAAVITDQTQASAINTLVTDLKSANIWNKMKAIYPFVGGTATTHKYNLKDPRDVDAAYRLVFNGGWTHSSTGALPNASNTYADTKLIPNSVLTLNSTHLSFYSRTDSAIGGADFGVSLTNPAMNMFTKWTDNNAYHDQHSSGADRLTFSMSGISTRAFFIDTRTSTTSLKVYRNGNQIGVTTVNQNVNSLPTSSIWISAHNSNGSFSRPSNRETSFASIGDGLTDAEAAAFYTAVQAYQTTLSRNV